ncbi:hypothetical protein [Paraglaciecola sp.]|uniref:hypothetical protein n=1 Tax=Paraglaciecola sp. TaxID=1920173 RepID=UPI00273EF58D|nr:hypothetical protein [Paraglaciecola sp.]MDP5031007.1 hypothetical protein [Paraglaciecola sp.]
MFNLAADVVLYQPSDSSGLLIYVPFTGQTVRLDFIFADFITSGSHTNLSFSSFCLYYPDTPNHKLEQVWTVLINEFILVQGGKG